MPLSLYDAAVANHREIEKALTQLERAINSAVRDNRHASLEALTRVQLLLVSVKAEARLTKIIHTPSGLTPVERTAVIGVRSAVDRWKIAVDTAFRRHYKVPVRDSLADALDHDPLAKYQTLDSVMTNELRHVIGLRNKLAHGQWLYPFNADLTALEPAAAAALRTETTLSLRYRDRLLVQLGNIVVDLVSSAAGFEARFNEYFVRIRRLRKQLEAPDFEAWTKKKRDRRVILAPVRLPPST